MLQSIPHNWIISGWNLRQRLWNYVLSEIEIKAVLNDDVFRHNVLNKREYICKEIPIVTEIANYNNIICEIHG